MKKMGLLLLLACAAIFVARGIWGEQAFSKIVSYLPALGASEAATGVPAGPGRNGQAAREAPPLPVETAAAVVEDMAIRRVTIGSVISQSTLSVTSNVQSMVVERVAREGSDVSAGDVIARLDSRTAKANVDRDKATLDRDQATLKGAEDNLARQRSLAERNVSSGQALDDAETAFATAQATVALDRATLEADMVTLDDMQIRAPFDGRLGAYAVAVGSIVQPGGAVVPLTKMSPVDVTFNLPEADIAALRKSAAEGDVTVRVTPSTFTPVSSGGVAGDVPVQTGTLGFIDSQVDPQSGTFTVKATLENADLSFWPGQSVSVDVVLGEKRLVAVPSVAVQPAQQGSIVYVVDKDQKIAIRTVTVGLMDGDRTGLSAGLEAGEKVVTEGQIKLADGMRVKDVTKPAVGGDNAEPTTAEKTAQSDAAPGEAGTAR